MDHNEAIDLLTALRDAIYQVSMRGAEVVLMQLQPEAVRAIGQAICPAFELEEQPAVTLMGIPVMVVNDVFHSASVFRLITTEERDPLFLTVCQHLRAYFDKYRKWPKRLALPEAAVATVPKSWSDGFAAPLGKVVASRHNVILMGD